MILIHRTLPNPPRPPLHPSLSLSSWLDPFTLHLSLSLSKASAGLRLSHIPNDLARKLYPLGQPCRALHRYIDTHIPIHGPQKAEAKGAW